MWLLGENCFESDADLFSEIRKSRHTKSDVTVTIDGKSNEEIPNAFGKVYGDLYNSIDDKENIDDIYKETNAEITSESLNDVRKIDRNIIKESLNRIKPNKSDPVWDFSSDLLKNGPSILLDHLSVLIQGFLIHGHISEILLLATMVPLVKDKLGDLSNSKNYRSIAISSLFLKI